MKAPSLPSRASTFLQRLLGRAGSPTPTTQNPKPSPSGKLQTPYPILQTAALCVAATAILLLRRPDQFTNPQLWAEDGIFFFQAREFGLRALTLELAGYFHLAPRLIAALSAALDPALVPHVFAGATLAFTLYVVSRILSLRCPLPFRPLCALALVLVPDASEVLLNTNNLQWVFIAGFLVLLLSREPTHATQRAHDLLAAALFSLSSPFSLVLTPFFVARAFLRRTRFSTWLAILVGALAAVQLISILSHPQPLPPSPTFDPGAALIFAGLRVTGSLWLSPWLHHPTSFPAGLLLTFTLAAVIAFLVLRPGAHRGVRAALTLVFAASLASTIYRCWHSMPGLCVPNNATRYVYPLQILLVWLLAFGLADRSRLVRFASAATLLLGLATNLPRLRIAAPPDKHWARYVPQLRAGEAVTIPINPDGWEFPFPARPPR